MPTKRYAITEAVRTLSNPIEVEMERCEVVGESPEANAPDTTVCKTSYFEIAKRIGTALRGTTANKDDDGLSTADLQRVSDAISIVRHGHRYRAPLAIVIELMIDSNQATVDAKKKQPDTSSSTTTVLPKATRQKKSPKRKKNSKS